MYGGIYSFLSLWVLPLHLWDKKPLHEEDQATKSLHCPFPYICWIECITLYSGRAGITANVGLYSVRAKLTLSRP